MIFFRENSLWRAFTEFMGYYDYEQNHHGIGNRPIDPGNEVKAYVGSIERHKRPGGRFYPARI